MQLVSSKDSQHYFSLDVIRAIGALFIVGYHGFQLVSHLYPKIYQWGFPAFFGMEYFFIMSGFLIAGLLFRLKNEATISAKIIIRKFWMRRWLRTFPAYFALLVLIVCIHGTTTSDGRSVVPYFFFLQNAGVTAPIFFPESWSICVEEWFYMLLPVIFLLAGKGNKRVFLWSILVFVLAITFTRIVYSIHGAIDFETGIKKILWLRIEAPFYGVVVWLLLDRYSEVSVVRRRILFVIGLVLEFVALFIYKYDALVYLKSALLWPILLSGFALMIPLLVTIRPSENYITLAVRKVADLSFSIYLTHLTLVQFTLLPLLHFDKSLSGTTKSVFAYLVLTTVATLVLHYLIEKPFLRLRRRLFPL